MTLAGVFYAAGTAFGLGVVYFVAAIPAAVALGLPVWAAALLGWAGYCAIAIAVTAVGEPLKNWLIRRLRINTEQNPKKLFWRIWRRWGLGGLALLAPVTCGPYVAALLALSLGERPARLLTWIAIGAVPWTLLFAMLTLFAKEAIQ